MKGLLLLLISLFTFAACGNKKEIAESAYSPPPTWVNNRPISSAYYTGIGLAQKTAGTSYQRTAKDNALSDLASEIKVQVNANSLLYTLEKDYKIQQEYQETIRTQSNLNLEDFEAVDAWEDGSAYWVYYRLNKDDYAARLDAKKKTAQALAIDFLARAETAKSQGQYAIGVDYYLRGLQAIEGFWSEENAVDYKQSRILLDNALFSGLKNLLSDARIQSDESVILNIRNKYSNKFSVKVSSTANGMPYEAVPVICEYFGAYGRVRNRYITNTDGRTDVLVNGVDPKAGDRNLKVQIDTDRLFEAFQTDPFLRKLTTSMRGSENQIAIVYEPPAIYISSKELNLGKPMSNNPLSAAVSNSLSRQNVRFVNRQNEADLVISMDSNTNSGGQDEGFYTALLTYTINVEERTTGEKRFQFSQSNVKGVDLNFERAGLKAYQNLERNIESEFMRKLVNDLF